MPISFRPYREIPFRRCDRSWPIADAILDPPPPMTLEGEGDAGIALARSLEDALCAELRNRGCQVMEYPAESVGETMLRICGPMDWTRDGTGKEPLCDLGLYRVGLGGVLTYGATAVAQMVMEHLMGKHVGPYDDPFNPGGDAEPLDLREGKEDPK